uniref:Uncharacterized protein n=1 Tax=Denticeps clupeoides TaxID=299321 RepID=A0AAY4AE50_9TELE
TREINPMQFEELFGCKNHQTCPKEAALLDYYVSGFWWAKETNFTSEQISFIVTLLHTLLGNVMGKQFACLSVHLTKVEPFTPLNSPFYSLFQHYTMYEFLFHHGRERQLHRHERTVEVMGPADLPAPLEEGMPADVFLRFLAPAPAEQLVEVWTEGCQLHNSICSQAAERDGGVAEEYSLEEVKEALEEALGEMLPGVQAEFTAKLRIREEACLARIERLQSASSK